MSDAPWKTTLGRRALLGAAASAAVAGPGRAQPAPKKGGNFRLGVTGSVSDNHDPATWGTSFIVNLGLWGAVYNNLTEIAADGRLVGELAEHFEPDSGAKTWRFTLRKGVTFQNGKPLEVADVIASLNHHRGPASASGAKAITDNIADIAADGADVVVITLKEGSADFPVLLTDYHLVIGPVMGGAIDWQNPVGTGGYAFVSHERGVRMALKRNPGYWKPGCANFDTVELISVPDTAARMSALVTGEVDVISRVDIKAMQLLARNRDLVVQEVVGTQQFTLPMFCDTDPFKDSNVRLALKCAIDRKALVQAVLRGHGRPGNDSPITPANRFFAADIPVREYDPDQAKSLLAKAGASGLKVQLSAADAAFNGAVDTAVLFQQQAAKAGINVDIRREPNDGYWTNVWLKKPFVAAYWAGRPTEDWMFSQVYAAGARWNDTHWSNERFNTLLVQARTELDEAKRRDMYREMQLLVRDDGGAIIPMYANYVFAHSNKITTPKQVGSNYDLDGWKCIERWWQA